MRKTSKIWKQWLKSSEKTKFTDGIWKLEKYYESFEAPNEGSKDWNTFFVKLDKWQKQYPNSVTARVATAKANLAAAWEVRGTGYTDTVSDEAWKTLKQKVVNAYNLLSEKPADLKNDCPERYHVLLTIAKIEGWSRPNFEYIFNKAITYEPSYSLYYIRKAEYLLPQWHGEEGEWLQFAKDAMKLVPANESKSIYTRIVQSMFGVGYRTFKTSGISWPLLQQGYLELDNNYPNSAWILNKFCFFAYLADDRKTAKELFSRIGDKPYLEAWQNDNRVFDSIKKWAHSSDK